MCAKPTASSPRTLYAVSSQHVPNSNQLEQPQEPEVADAPSAPCKSTVPSAAAHDGSLTIANMRKNLAREEAAQAADQAYYAAYQSQR